nr:MAG TPA: hypothetical protein [Caudoviricetes sp.]
MFYRGVGVVVYFVCGLTRALKTNKLTNCPRFFPFINRLSGADSTNLISK